VTIDVHPEALSEHEGQISWYESRTPGLGLRYHVAFDSMVLAICEGPRRFGIAHAPDIRRAMLKDFPFSVMFRALACEIQILAVAAHCRRVGYWADRIQYPSER
jgi:hypothetical protein